jgi:tryptophan-rich sensory protein
MNYLASSGQLRASLLRWSLFTVPLLLVLGSFSARAGGGGPGNPWFDNLVNPHFPDGDGKIWQFGRYSVVISA